MASVLFLNLEGTRVRNRHQQGDDPTDFELIPEAIEALQAYSDWIVIGIDDRTRIAKGYESREYAVAEEQYTMERLSALAAIYFCPDPEGLDCYAVSTEKVTEYRFEAIDLNNFPTVSKGIKHLLIKGISHGCSMTGNICYASYRQPGTGMLTTAIADLRARGISVDRLLMVGDHETDFVCAVTANIPFISYLDWYKIPSSPPTSLKKSQRTCQWGHLTKAPKLRPSIYCNPELEICASANTARPYAIYGTSIFHQKLIDPDLFRILIKYNHLATKARSIAKIPPIAIKSQPKILRYRETLSQWQWMLRSMGDTNEWAWNMALEKLNLVQHLA